MDDELAAVPRERARRRGADARRCAGDEDDLAFEIRSHVCSLLDVAVRRACPADAGHLARRCARAGVASPATRRRRRESPRSPPAAESSCGRRARRGATAPARANGTGTTSRLWYLGVSASRGSTDTPSPDATMLRTVSSELVRVTCASARLSSGHASSTWSRKQWPTLSRIVCSPASSSGRIDLRFAHLWPAARRPGTAPRTGTRSTTPGGANGSAMIAASMRPDFERRFEVLGQVLLDVERHLRRAARAAPE